MNLDYIESGLHDETSETILRCLLKNARISVAELARNTGLSAPSVSERMRRLEDAGLVSGYSAVVRPEALGYSVGVFIRIRPIAGQVSKVVNLVAEMEEIVECHRVTGEDCFIAKAYLRSVAELEPLVDRLLPIAQTHTSIIQSTPVPVRLPPIKRS